jgi:hypothetical protein
MPICRLLLYSLSVLILITMSSPEERPPFKESSFPIERMQLGLAASFIIPSPKKKHGDDDQFADDKPFIDERKPSSKTVERSVLNNGEHTLILVTARMIHSAVWNSEWFILKDGRLLHMVKLVGAIRNFREKIKHVQINVEDCK